MKRILCGIAAACLLLTLCSGCRAAGPGESVSSAPLPVLRIGIDNYAPYSYRDANGDYTGIDIEMAREAVRRIGLEPEFVQIVWDEKNRCLQERSVDCLWSCFTMDGREERYLWAGPYMKSRQVVVVREDSEIHTLQQLNGRNVAVQSSTKPEEIFLDSPEGAVPSVKHLYCFKSIDETFAALRKGYVDACASHEALCRELIREAPAGTYRILEEPLMEVRLGVAFDLFRADEFAGTAEALKTVLHAMREDGTTARILESYGINTDWALG